MSLLQKTTDRRWCQFGVKAMLLFMTITCAALAPIFNGAREQAAIVRAIEKGGGECRYAHQYRRRPEYLGEVDLTAKPQWPRWLVDRLGIDFFEKVVVVHLCGDLDPEIVRSLVALSALEELYVVKSELLPSDVQHLSALTKVRVLFIQLEHPPDYDLLCQLPQSDVIPLVIKRRETDVGK